MELCHAWKTVDGEVFEDPIAARKHEAEVAPLVGFTKDCKIAAGPLGVLTRYVYAATHWSTKRLQETLPWVDLYHLSPGWYEIEGDKWTPVRNNEIIEKLEKEMKKHDNLKW